MKWAALILFIVVGIGLAQRLRQDPRAALAAAFLLGLLPFVMDSWHLIVAPYALPMWPGFVKGWEVGLIDAVAIACLVGIPRTHSQLPFRFVLLFYIATVSLAVLWAPNFNIALSYPIQLARMFLVFAAVARLCSSPIGVKATLQGLFAGLAFQAAMAMWAKAGGAIQTGGTFSHQNTLGYVSHLVFLPAFGLLLSGLWTRWALFGLISGAIVITLTVSRATLGFAAIGLIVTFILSASSQWTKRKGMVVLATAALIGLSSPLILSTFEQRFAAKGGSFTNVDEERDAFARAAGMMIADYPFGVGPNHYVLLANTKGYSHQAGVIWNSGSRSAHVHNSFLLVQAETGFLGLFAMVLLLGTALATSVRQAFKGRRSPLADVLIGISGGLCALILHSFYEWAFVTYQAQYMLAISLGMAVGIARQINSSATVRRRRSATGETARARAALPA